MIQELHRDIFTEILREAGKSPAFIKKLGSKYEYVDARVIDLLCSDDGLCGIGRITFGPSPDCDDHDLELLAAKYGYPVTTNSESALRFTWGAIKNSIRNPRSFLLTLPKIAIGSTAGWAIWLGRSMAAVRKKNGTWKDNESNT
jgi:hypothetical protein